MDIRRGLRRCTGAGLAGPLLLGLLAVGTGARSTAAEALRIQVLAVMGNAALVRIGDEERILRPGEPGPAGIELLDAHAGGARLRIDGREEFIPRGVVVAPLRAPEGETPARITLWAGEGGFFVVHGLVDNSPVRMLVDTGASDVTFSSRDAERLGISYRDGRRLGVITASGNTMAHETTVGEIRVGPIRVQHVTVLVIEGDYPKVPLLGMTFLGRLQMNRDGSRMDLVQKF